MSIERDEQIAEAERVYFAARVAADAAHDAARAAAAHSAWQAARAADATYLATIARIDKEYPS